jgi:cell division septation protein DedD
MSRGRFGILLALLVVAVTTASFLGVRALIEEEEPTVDAPTTTTTTTSTSTTVPGELVTPAFVAVVGSDGDEATAQARRDELTESGYDAGVLHSDDYASLEPGFWVAYVGPFPDDAGAQGAVDELATDGYDAYVRCVGTQEQCS